MAPANAHLDKVSSMDTAKFHNQHHASQDKFLLIQDHALVIMDTPLPPLVQVVFNKQTTASLDRP
jgi:hypothetical protein